jgi:Domain of unknown function (DUF4263)
VEVATTPIEAAHRKLTAELRKRRLGGATFRIVGEEWLQINLVREDRQIWLGHIEGAGYFVSWDRSEDPHSYFELDADGLSLVLAELPSADSAISSDDTERARELLDSLTATEPDSERMREILDETPATEEAIDVLATITSLKAFRNAIDRLRWLIDTQDELRHEEKNYQQFFASNPWILGHYNELLAQVSKIWLGTEVDLLLTNALGYVDVIELKRPDTRILVRSRASWRASKELSDAVAQARRYLGILDDHRREIQENLEPGHSPFRIFRANAVIIAGKTPEEWSARDTLRDMNATDSRVSILTYDDVLALAEATIKLFERRLTTLRSLPG